MNNFFENVQRFFLPGEVTSELFAFSKVNYICPKDGAIPGELVLSNYRLFFQGAGEKKSFHVIVRLGSVYRIEKKGRVSTKGINTYGINLYCRDMRLITFTYKQEDHSRRDMFNKLQQLVFPLSHQRPLFAFVYGQSTSKSQFLLNNGWNVYQAKEEFARQGINFKEQIWRIKINEDYKLCPTYPSIIVVPYNASDELLEKVACYRSRRRLPVLSWLNPRNKASVCRCSQPLVGVKGKRSTYDEGLINLIRFANVKERKLTIVDARSRANAVANKARGGGYENEENYDNVKVMFLDIPNIHVIRDSARRLREVCYSETEDKRWFSHIESTDWLEYIRLILNGAAQIADLVERKNTSLVIHCSDGWDRTSQLTSLLMLMLDPYYRSLDGFEVLIEKEWISFGHKFAERIGHGVDKHTDENRSPIFLQFIDCVWQLTVHYPNAFEFNEVFLITVMDHLYSCLFGTFLCNSEKERKIEKIRDRTFSLWSYINSNKKAFINPLYSKKTKSQILIPIKLSRQVNLWKNYYYRWSVFHPVDIDLIQKRTNELMRRKSELRYNIAKLESYLIKKYPNSTINSKQVSYCPYYNSTQFISHQLSTE